LSNYHNRTLIRLLAETARQLQTLALLPLVAIRENGLESEYVAPLVAPSEVGEMDTIGYAHA